MSISVVLRTDLGEPLGHVQSCGPGAGSGARGRFDYTSGTGAGSVPSARGRKLLGKRWQFQRKT